MTTSGQAADASELRELRAELRALRAEVARLRARTPEGASRTWPRAGERVGERSAADRETDREISDTAREIVERGDEEVQKLVRGLTLGYLEQVRLVAQTVDEFVGRVNERSQARYDDTVEDLTRRLPRDVTAELLDAVRRSLDIPGQVADRVRASYDEAETQAATVGRRRARDTAAAPETVRESTTIITPDSITTVETSATS